MEAAIFSRERPTVGSILNLTFKLYGANFLAITLIGVLAFVPLALVIAGGAAAQQSPFFGVFTALVGGLALVVTVPAGYAAAIHAVFQAALGAPVDIAKSIGVGLRKLPRANGVMFLMVLAVCLGTLALVIPGIIAYFAFLLAIPAVLSYNFFVRLNRVTNNKFDTFAHDLHDFFATGSRVGEVSNQR